MRKALFIVSILLFSILFFIPLIYALSNADIAVISDILNDNYLKHVIAFTFKQALISSIISLAVGLPGSWILSHIDFKLNKTIKTIYYIPYVLPSILVVLGFVIFYGNTGILSKILGRNIHFLYSFKAVIAAHVFFNFPIVANIVSEKWQSLDNSIEDEARCSGVSEFLIFKQITLPRLRPAIISSMILVFLFCFTSFAIILVLGGGPSLSTIEVEIYKLSRITFNIPKAASLSVISLLSALIIVFLYSLFDYGTHTEENSSSVKVPLRKLSDIKRLLVIIYLIVSTLYIVLPVLGIFVRSFDFDSLHSLSITAVSNTVFCALISSFISIFIASSICSVIKDNNKSLLSSVLMIPMATSSIILGLGYFIISSFNLQIPDYILIVLCHGVLNSPYALRSILPVYRSIPRDTIQAAELDGYSDFSIFLRLEIPYIKSSLVSAYMFCFALSCGELNSTLMIAKSDFLTIPLQIQRMIAAYNYKGACAMGSILVIMSAAIFALSQIIKDRRSDYS